MKYVASVSFGKDSLAMLLRLIEERKEKYFKETCRCCRFNCENSKGLPDDIGKPIKSEVDYFPKHKGCKNFEWD